VGKLEEEPYLQTNSWCWIKILRVLKYDPCLLKKIFLRLITHSRGAPNPSQVSLSQRPKSKIEDYSPLHLILSYQEQTISWPLSKSALREAVNKIAALRWGIFLVMSLIYLREIVFYLRYDIFILLSKKVALLSDFSAF
jgi:hypothetical protein